MATSFALDVPKLALLVLPQQYSVAKTVEELKALGADARAMGLDTIALQTDRSTTPTPADQIPISDANITAEATEDEPILLVSSTFNVRGLDFPTLTHVFILGPTCIETKEAYDHIAGRVGRFGRSGKVVTFAKGFGEHDEEKVMRGKFDRWKITHTPFSALEE